MPKKQGNLSWTSASVRHHRGTEVPQVMDSNLFPASVFQGRFVPSLCKYLVVDVASAHKRLEKQGISWGFNVNRQVILEQSAQAGRNRDIADVARFGRIDS